MEKFKQLGLSEGMLSIIQQAGFTEPSEIQLKTIPLVLANKDVIGSSATGSGKTLAFGAGIIEKLSKGKGIQALIMTPTRELAEQVAQNLRHFSRHLGLVVQEVYGGVGMNPQIKMLRYADIVVGTPGRLLDHIQRRTINLSRVRFLVLDEADRMLDMGFIRDVESIIRVCPKERQTLLFSATISREIDSIANRHMKNPVYIEVDNQVDAAQLYQKYYDIEAGMKFSLLVQLLRLEKKGVVMVFCNTRGNVDKLTRLLNQKRIHALAIHGGLSQNRRSETLQAFHSRETLILVCTDVAARGLDIKDVSHVYNFDIPSTSNEYIHRIGRTARAGKNGVAVSFVSEGDHSEFRQICKEKQLDIERENVPQLDEIIAVPFSSNSDRKAARRGNSRGGGGGRNRGRSFGNGSRGNDRSSHGRGGGRGFNRSDSSRRPNRPSRGGFRRR
ncbi:MAG: DEAD/DEAH box helicase [archaeon]